GRCVQIFGKLGLGVFANRRAEECDADCRRYPPGTAQHRYCDRVGAWLRCRVTLGPALTAIDIDIGFDEIAACLVETAEHSLALFIRAKGKVGTPMRAVQ